MQHDGFLMIFQAMLQQNYPCTNASNPVSSLAEVSRNQTACSNARHEALHCKCKYLVLISCFTHERIVQ